MNTYAKHQALAAVVDTLVNDPAASDWGVSNLTGVSRSTVRRVRLGLVADGRIADTRERHGIDGHTRSVAAL